MTKGQLRAAALVAMAVMAVGDAAGQRVPYRPEREYDDATLTPETVRAHLRRYLAVLEPWVGTWSGKARWTHCKKRGRAKIRMDIAPTMTSDGAQLMKGLGEIAWTNAKGDLTFGSEAVDVTLTSGEKNAKLVLTTAAGCVGKATLVRPTSGMASCDTLRALATIEASCDRLDAETRDDDLARVTAAWRGWSKLNGRKKTRQASACATEVDALRDAVIGCGFVLRPGSPDEVPLNQYRIHVDPPSE